MRTLNRVEWLWALLAAITVVAVANLCLGLSVRNAAAAAGGLLGLTFVGVRATRRLRQARAERFAGAKASSFVTAADDYQVDDDSSLEPDACQPGSLNELIDQMFAHGRYALLLRPQIAGQLSPRQIERSTHALHEEMALVPDGEVVLEDFDVLVDGLFETDESDSPPGAVVHVQRVFLDRYPVTNRQYLQFLKSGGYQQMALWDPEVWPAMLDFVDQTGEPGPRFWHKGRFARGDDNLPVTGVSWYEAAAFARWAGKRLPTDAEWVKAASWPVVLSASTRLQRRYPWGDSMDRKRANLWGSGPGRPVSVREFSDGASVGGIHQLIGNVWEWTGSEFSPDATPREQIMLSTTMRSLRGGAYDTYFDNHATCQFATGDNPVVRKQNVGFRCALSVCDLSLYAPQQESPPAAAAPETNSPTGDAIPSPTFAAPAHEFHSVCQEVTS